MNVTFWGVRGSIPVPGRTTLKFGGNTSCVEVRDGNLLIILDAGSGLRELGANLLEQGPGAHVAHLFITHKHWDHIQGFPFFAPAYMPGNNITVYGPVVLHDDLICALEGQMDSPFFPVTLDSMGSTITFRELDPGDGVQLEDIQVTSMLLTHPGVTLGYRIQSPRGSLCYITDWESFGRYVKTEPAGTQLKKETSQESAERIDEKVVEFCKNADLLICDSQYDSKEYRQKRGWGHACIDDSVRLGLEAGARRLALFHHDPTHEDARIDQMVAYCRDRVRASGKRMQVFAAQERKTIQLDRRAAASSAKKG